jgi:hypothetical protein
MFPTFHYRHIPALFTIGAQFWGTIWPLVGGSTRSIMGHYGLPPRIANVPQTWPAWNAGNARTACLGILMAIFYARGQYDVVDTFMMVIGAYLGLVDCLVLWQQGLRSAGIGRLSGSLIFGSLGFVGFTQGRTR